MSGASSAPCAGFICSLDNVVWYQCACVCASVGVVCPERVALCAAVLIIRNGDECRYVACKNHPLLFFCTYDLFNDEK